MKDICKVLNADLESVLNGEYDSFGNIDYDGNLYWVRVCMNSSLPVYVPINNTNKNWEITYALYFGRDENCSTKIAEFRFFDGEPKKHIINQMSQMILHWISKTRIKKPKEKKCEFKYLDEDEVRINKASENLGMKFETRDNFEHERDRFLKDIDERDQSISDLIDANEKLSKENDKLSVDISREKDKHDAATEKCKELAKDVEFWKEKTYEIDKKNCELRSRNRELEKDCDARADVINYQRERIEKLEKELAEKSKQGYFDTGMEENLKKDLMMVNCVVENVLKPYGYSSMYAPFSKHPTELEMYKALLRIHEIIEGDISNIADEADNKKNPKEFKEILVRECFGRPYYEILYKEDGKMHVGYSSYKLDKVSEWLKEFFID